MHEIVQYRAMHVQNVVYDTIFFPLYSTLRIFFILIHGIESTYSELKTFDFTAQVFLVFIINKVYGSDKMSAV